MDMQTLKSIIIELRNQGMTFQEIADTLKQNYGIVKTRQAISGLYNRAKIAATYDEQTQKLVRDIVNTYCLVDNATQVAEELHNMGQDIPYRKVLDIINKETEYINSVRDTIVATMEARLPDIKDIRELMGIQYKNVTISTKRFNEYFEEACKHHIKSSILGNLQTIYKLTSNKGMVKSIGQQFNIGIRTDDLK